MEKKKIKKTGNSPIEKISFWFIATIYVIFFPVEEIKDYAPTYVIYTIKMIPVIILLENLLRLMGQTILKKKQAIEKRKKEQEQQKREMWIAEKDLHERAKRNRERAEEFYKIQDDIMDAELTSLLNQTEQTNSK